MLMSLWNNHLYSPPPLPPTKLFIILVTFHKVYTISDPKNTLTLLIGMKRYLLLIWRFLSYLRMFDISSRARCIFLLGFWCCKWLFKVACSSHWSFANPRTGHLGSNPIRGLGMVRGEAYNIDMQYKKFQRFRHSIYSFIALTSLGRVWDCIHCLQLKLSVSVIGSMSHGVSSDCRLRYCFSPELYFMDFYTFSFLSYK